MGFKPSQPETLSSVPKAQSCGISESSCFILGFVMAVFAVSPPITFAQGLPANMPGGWSPVVPQNVAPDNSRRPHGIKQSDEELLKAAELFERQGRQEQAQRIYAVLSRRQTVRAWQTTARSQAVGRMPNQQWVPPTQPNPMAAASQGPALVATLPVVQAPPAIPQPGMAASAGLVANPNTLGAPAHAPPTSPAVPAPTRQHLLEAAPLENVIAQQKTASPIPTTSTQKKDADWWDAPFVENDPRSEASTPLTLEADPIPSAVASQQSPVAKPGAEPVLNSTPVDEFAIEPTKPSRNPSASGLPPAIVNRTASQPKETRITAGEPPPFVPSQHFPSKALVQDAFPAENAQKVVTSPNDLSSPAEAVPVQAEQGAPKENFETLENAAEQLAEETDAIRIVPRNAARPMTTAQRQLDELSQTRTESTPDAILKRPADEQPAQETKRLPRRPVCEPNDRKSRTTTDAAPAGSQTPRRRTTHVQSPDDAGENDEIQPKGSVEFRPTAVRKPAFDLGLLVATPEFREIHTRTVLQGLELLAESDPRHRAIGAMQIGQAGTDARTAVPALRNVLAKETNANVRLQIAKTILKCHPQDRGAIDCLGALMQNPSDAQLRENAAGVLRFAAPTGNLFALDYLTSALDDGSPRVRMTAARAIAEFGPGAIECVPRLEAAAASEVPIVRQAMLIALARLKGHPVVPDAPPVAAPRSDTPAVVVPERAASDVDFSEARPMNTVPLPHPSRRHPLADDNTADDKEISSP